MNEQFYSIRSAQENKTDLILLTIQRFWWKLDKKDVISLSFIERMSINKILLAAGERLNQIESKFHALLISKNIMFGVRGISPLQKLQRTRFVYLHHHNPSVSAETSHTTECHT